MSTKISNSDKFGHRYLVQTHGSSLQAQAAFATAAQAQLRQAAQRSEAEISGQSEIRNEERKENGFFFKNQNIRCIYDEYHEWTMNI